MKKLITICLLCVCVMTISTSHASILSTAADFAVLGGSAVTNADASTFITGDVGSAPTPAVTGITSVMVDGTLYLAADTATATAHTDLITAYNSLASMTVTQDLTGQNLGGLVLTPGVYLFSSTALLTGTLTLSGTGDFIFLIDSTLTTASGSSVIATSGANVYWVVGSSATLGIGTAFVGNILASESITLDGGTLEGRALAINGAVSIATQETITIPEPATISMLCFGVLSIIRHKKLV